MTSVPFMMGTALWKITPHHLTHVVHSLVLLDLVSAPKSEPLELTFNKLNQLVKQMLDLQAAASTRKGPLSKRKHSSMKHKTTTTPPVQKCVASIL